ncbi:Dual specificity protein phosphatase 3 [Symbiodinium microadriaticum]|uniref:protein-tyrosine-phosphatase n=1 Tax=Symbiodinium microadriaticum TaxID=2951 RepID=A0A1Q9CJ96_SYMMI|nr:Dual specificity protein phosphatase 3 [Symbiodinium microadriaticum]
MAPDQVEKWLRGLGSMLPREAISALIEEVHRRGMDGEAFDVLIASRAMPALGDAVRPAHMAMLRRCWNANKPFSAAAPCKAEPCEQGQALPRFSPPPRGKTELEPPEPQEEHRPSDFPSPECEPENGHGATSTPLSSALMKQKAAKPPQVPRLDLSFVHQRGNSENLTKHEWKPGSRQSLAGSGADVANRSGFASASPEDQQRIAEFYGYRDEGFVATMAGLRTDLLRPRLYVGNMADAAYWPMLKKLGITHIVNCAIEAQKVPPAYESHGIKYLLLPWQDREEETRNLTRQKFKAVKGATKYISTALQGRNSENSENVVLVHCVQGLSRSAALVCAYLMEFEGLGLDRALSEVKSKHKGCLSSPHWQTLLHKFNAELLRGS